MTTFASIFGTASQVGEWSGHNMVGRLERLAHGRDFLFFSETELEENAQAGARVCEYTGTREEFVVAYKTGYNKGVAEYRTRKAQAAIAIEEIANAPEHTEEEIARLFREKFGAPVAKKRGRK